MSPDILLPRDEVSPHYGHYVMNFIVIVTRFKRFSKYRISRFSHPTL